MAFSSDKSAIEAEVLKILKVFPALTPVRGKRPYRQNWQKESTLCPDVIAGDLHSGRATGVGLRCGKISGGILCVDFDGESAYSKYLELSGGAEPPTSVAWTSGKHGRFQLALLVPEDKWDAIATKKIPTAWDENGKANEFLEIRWDRCQSVLPPSVHPETGGYTWVNSRSPDQCPIEYCPDFIYGIGLEELHLKHHQPHESNFDTSNPWDIRNFQEYLEGGGSRRAEWTTWKCPAHNGQSSDSLHINEATGQFKCHAGCDSKEVYRAALDLAVGYGYQVPKGRSGHTCGGLINPLNRLKELLRKSGWSNWGWKRKKSSQPNQSSTEPTTVIEYQSGEYQQTLSSLVQQGLRNILDKSGTGEGKSYRSGELKPKLLGAKQLIYISNEHRNPTTPTLQALPDLQGRHNGLYRDHTGKLRRVTSSQPWVVGPNCAKTNTIAALRAKNVDGADTASLICSRCPFLIGCQNGKDSINYLHQRHEVLDEEYFRSAPGSLPSPDGDKGFDYSNVVLIWDDVKLNVHKSFDVTALDLAKTVATLALHHPTVFALLQPFLSELVPYLTGAKKPNNPYGWKLLELQQLLPKVIVNNSELRTALEPNLDLLNPVADYGVDTADFNQSVKARFSESDATTAERVAKDLLLNWLPDCLEILTVGKGYLNINHQKLTITVPDYRLQRIAAAALANIFLDATADVGELAYSLGIDHQQIITIKQVTPKTTNLEVTQVAIGRRLGISSRRKNKDGDDTFLSKRINAVVNQIRVDHPDAKINTIDFKKNGGNGSWWVDSRGVNDFEQTEILVLIGTPTPSISALEAEFTVLCGRSPVEGTEAINYPIFTDHDLPDGIEAFYSMNVSADPEFRDFVRRRVLAEIEQAIGRLRANRRSNKQLKVYLIGDYPLERAVTLIKASTITPEAMDKQEIFITAVKGAISQLKANGKKLTQSAIAALTGYSQQYLSKLKKLLLMLLEPYIAKVVNKPEPDLDPKSTEWVSNIYLPALANDPMEDLIEGVFATFDIYGNGFKEIWEATGTPTQIKLLQVLLTLLPQWQLKALLDKKISS